MAELSRIPVTGAAPYDVVVGRGVLSELRDLLGDGARQVALCYPAELGHLAELVVGYLEEVQILRLPLPDGEAAKTADVAVDAWERLGAAGFTRSDAVVTVGGGATTDVGGFLAATWLRGVPVLHVPTTLLAMVDAAIGGKTGINTAAGKNLVGSFHEPVGVACDLDLLGSLPPAELVAGFGEVVKCGFIADPAILELIEQSPSAALDPASGVLRELVERSIRVKASVVSADLRETAGTDDHPGREVLNYGHTLAHAIEKSTDYAVRHGEAVALGMVFASELAHLAGLLDAAVVARHETVLESLGLPIRFDRAPFDELLATMRVDKKARGAQLRFVVLESVGKPVRLVDPAEELLRAAYEHLRGWQ